MRSRAPLPPAAASVLDWLRDWAERDPDRTLIAERCGPGWRRTSFAETQAHATTLAAGLRAAGLKPGDRVATLAPNGADHLRVAFACYMTGLVYAPLARQYAAAGADPRRLTDVLDVLEPAAVYLDGAEAASRLDARLVFGPADFAGLSRPPDALSGAHAPDAPAKILMTSGSSGPPKAVVQTQRTMTVNMAMTLAVWPFARARPPVLVDWLPWNHSFGGNHLLHMVLACGGTLYVDDGGGRPDGAARTADNIRNVRPTFYAAVPAGYEALLPMLETDAGLRAAFFSRLDLMFSAGAAMSRPTWDRLRRVSAAARGAPVPIAAGWGSTELGPGATMVHGAALGPESLGVPLPGVTVKLTPVDGKLELRVRSPSATPGYWRDAERTAAAFDVEGFYRSGDAGLPAVDDDPDAGLVFDGRIADDFKLANGSWVNASRLRSSLVAMGAPHVRDVVLLAPDAPVLGALFWLADEADPAMLDTLVARHNSGAIGATTRIACYAALADPPDPSAGELSDKGQIRGHVLRRRRSAMVGALYARCVAAAA